MSSVAASVIISVQSAVRYLEGAFFNVILFSAVIIPQRAVRAAAAPGRSARTPHGPATAAPQTQPVSSETAPRASS